MDKTFEAFGVVQDLKRRSPSLYATVEQLYTICDELLSEIQDVTARPKFIKYFPSKDVDSLLEFLQLIGESVNPKQSVQLCRDEADNYLLALAIEANADYLVTGDQDLLVLKEIHNCRIVDVAEFEQEVCK